MSIKLLPPRLANQIAAGEVVERPASVVKELVENSLDAGATRIELDIERGGHKRIKLRDNGHGIAKDELTLALSRHATSKISTLDDLEQILSLGFRGEALASISSVSRLTLISKPASQPQAWQARCEGRDMEVTIEPVAHPDGTTIDVADIFYNTPARRKFLRAEKTEYQHIEDVIKRIALSRPDVSFTLRHNAKSMKRYAATGSDQLASRVAQVCGKGFIAQSVHTQCDYGAIKLEAWLGDQRQMRSSNDCQFSFVNLRGMRDKLMLHALRQAYDAVLDLPEQPAFVLYLSLDPKDVDVNVHPAKHEVRFQQSRLVHDFIYKTVSEALSECSASEFSQANEAVEPAHDYIRPIATLSSATPQFTASEKAPPTARGALVSTTPNSGRSTGVSGHYQQYHNQLMTPADNSAQEVSTSLAYIPLSADTRLYSKEQSSALLTSTDLLTPWVSELCNESTVGQPLLMPVMVHGQLTAQSGQFLHELGFEINTVGEKSRLLKVPASLRALPWALVFGAVVEASPVTIQPLCSALAGALHGHDATQAQCWSWFEQLAISQQSTILGQYAIQCSNRALIQYIQQEKPNV